MQKTQAHLLLTVGKEKEKDALLYEQLVIRLSNFDPFLRLLLSEYLNSAKTFQMKVCVSISRLAIYDETYYMERSSLKVTGSGWVCKAIMVII